MKVAYLTPEFPHEKTLPSAGIGASIFNLSKGLMQLNHSVIVIVYGQDRDEVIQEKDLTIFKVKNVKFKGFSLFLTQKKVQRLINDLYSTSKIDIVEAPDWTGFTSFLNVKCPLIIKLHGSDTYFCHLDNRSVKFKNKFLEKLALQKADGVIAVSNFVGELTNKVFSLNLKFNVIPNAIDVKLFNPIESKENECILYFGTLIRKKGVLEIPQIFNEVHKVLPSAKLILIGKDASDIKTGNASTWQLMKNEFSVNAKSQVQYKGQVPYAEIKNYINEATVCIFPSFAEALPVSWLEAMAMKKAIVASNIGWASEMIANTKEGVLVDPKDHKAFSKAIISILNDVTLQNNLGDAAIVKVKNMFDLEVIAKKNIDFYKTLINNV
ncbi:glycosyltransferase family 4 protein [Seonamhaeicola algicola]|uniref:Glycosyltransferase family 4 protein n=1 Tax=Seonamhaeicola algicola TaxID=1719036 RepID=A0A5C7AVC5_9FLAO|nr:glycosyltransferase family 4 protein [Seonamhaeicola algicola]TXE12024.1 glycosyltransferase family 4 protein [Seonamhaeicola algicola]